VTKAQLIERLKTVPDGATVLLSTEGYIEEATDVEQGHYAPNAPDKVRWRHLEALDGREINAVVIACD
jgi:hypothetical protein